MLIVQGLLLFTAWLGAELVYRYGLGVMSLPQSENEDHSHLHGKEMNASEIDHSSITPAKNREQHDQAHDHKK